MVRMRARSGWSGKGFHRRLTWLAMLLACWIWTAPAAAQSSPGEGDPGGGEKLLLMCRGFFEAVPHKDGDATDIARKLLIRTSNERAYRKQIPLETERSRYIDRGRAVVRSKNRKLIDDTSSTCLAIVFYVMENEK